MWRFCVERHGVSGRTFGLLRKTDEGKVNRLMDDLFHALVECDSEVSLRGFVGYNAPKLLRFHVIKD